VVVQYCACTTVTIVQVGVLNHPRPQLPFIRTEVQVGVLNHSRSRFPFIATEVRVGVLNHSRR
jgi:hypothetical protein